MTATSVPKGAKRRCKSQGQERHQGEPAKMNTELILKHNNLIGHSLPYLQYYGGFPGGSMAAFPLKIAPKHDTKICYPSIAAVTAEMGGFLFKEAPCRECRKRGSWNCPSSSMNGGG